LHQKFCNDCFLFFVLALKILQRFFSRTIKRHISKYIPDIVIIINAFPHSVCTYVTLSAVHAQKGGGENFLIVQAIGALMTTYTCPIKKKWAVHIARVFANLFVENIQIVECERKKPLDRFRCKMDGNTE